MVPKSKKNQLENIDFAEKIINKKDRETESKNQYKNQIENQYKNQRKNQYKNQRKNQYKNQRKNQYKIQRKQYNNQRFSGQSQGAAMQYMFNMFGKPDVYRH